ELSDLQAAARRWGLSEGGRVVVHDDSGNTAAARAWWLLRYAGVAQVTLLDGALGAWRAAGLPVESGVPPDPPPGTVVLRAGARRFRGGALPRLLVRLVRRSRPPGRDRAVALLKEPRHDDETARRGSAVEAGPPRGARAARPRHHPRHRQERPPPHRPPFR